MQKHWERLAPVLDLEAILVSSEPSDGAIQRCARRRRWRNCGSRYRSIGSGWPRCSTWKRWSPPVTALPIGRCKRDDVAQFPIGLLTLIGTGYVATERGTVLMVAPIHTECDTD